MCAYQALEAKQLASLAAHLVEVGAHALPPVRDAGIVAGPELAAQRPQTDDSE